MSEGSTIETEKHVSAATAKRALNLGCHRFAPRRDPAPVGFATAQKAYAALIGEGLIVPPTNSHDR